ncbi:hypothetical protein KEM48_006115 [Puccinia striiformis f. sp. tritici PST-130]|nr:hypothetical protein KEM48_006115 [Puccinia striiformis f. sp. tritici PST-130]
MAFEDVKANPIGPEFLEGITARPSDWKQPSTQVVVLGFESQGQLPTPGMTQYRGVGFGKGSCGSGDFRGPTAPTALGIG